MRLRRFVLVTAAVTVVTTAMTGVALGELHPGSIIRLAAAALQQNPVYVDHEARPGLTDAEADRLREEIAEADAGPIYIAVLPDQARLEAGGDPDQALRMLGEGVGRYGTYAIVIGTDLRAGSTEGTPFESGEVPSIAEQAVQESGDQGVAAVLSNFVGGLAQAAEGDGEAGGGDTEPSPSFGVLPLLLLIGLGAFLFFTLRRRHRQQLEDRRQFEEVREAAVDDLVALGNDLRALEIDVEMPDANPAAKGDYVRALESYEKASAALDRARTPDDLSPVSATLDEGRYALACARARLEHRALPERRAPCFFDPRHGPSVRDVQWAPPGGAPRDVPACAPDAERVESGEEPLSREVMVGGRMTPYWNAPYYYGPWAGGYFGGFGLFEGMLLGSLLSGGFGWGGGFGYDGASVGDGGDGGAGGDFGGDFGGGDFGGGDFGGGDFGGGDFGG